MGAHTVWKGHLSFGLLNIPVRLYVGARDKRVELHTYHTKCNGPVKEPKYCNACQEMLAPEQIYKGYAIDGKIVQITKEEIEQLTPSSGKVLEITECVKWADVDPLYLAESFYLLPEDVGRKAYGLLVKTLTDTGRVAIAQLAKSGRENVILLRPKGNGLIVHYIWYPTEIARLAEFEDLEAVAFTASELKLARQLAESFDSEFNPEIFEDGYYMRLTQLIESKLDKSVQAPQAVNVAVAPPAQDLMAALSASLATPKPRRSIKLNAEPEPAKVAEKTKGKKGKAA
jgi:DNA end-binding protein Ku